MNGTRLRRILRALHPMNWLLQQNPPAWVGTPIIGYKSRVYIGPTHMQPADGNGPGLPVPGPEPRPGPDGPEPQPVADDRRLVTV